MITGPARGTNTVLSHARGRTHGVSVIDKREGETPLMALERLRKEAQSSDLPMTYAGRLDPMASGTLLVLTGEQCKNKAAYSGLDKEYEFEILLGVSSDAGDILGMADLAPAVVDVDMATVRSVAGRIRGAWNMPYPAYASKPVDGKPLFRHARDGTLDTVERPVKRVHIHELYVHSIAHIRSDALLLDIERRLKGFRPDASSGNPYGDFRKDAIAERWRTLLAEREIYTLVRMRAVVSSGTYIRSLAPRIAIALGTTGLAYSIRRTRIGRYLALPYRGLWLSSYR